MASVKSEDEQGFLVLNLILDCEHCEIVFAELKGDLLLGSIFDTRPFLGLLHGFNPIEKDCITVIKMIDEQIKNDKRKYLITNLYYDALSSIQEFLSQ